MVFRIVAGIVVLIGGCGVLGIAVDLFQKGKFGVASDLVPLCVSSITVGVGCILWLIAQQGKKKP